MRENNKNLMLDELARATKLVILKDSPTVAKNRLEALKKLSLSLLQEINALDQARTLNLTNGKINLAEEVVRYEKDLIRTVLIKMGGNQRRAAKFLGTKPSTLNAKMTRYGIDSKYS